MGVDVRWSLGVRKDGEWVAVIVVLVAITHDAWRLDMWTTASSTANFRRCIFP